MTISPDLPDPARPQRIMRRIAYASFAALSALCLFAFVSLGLAGVTHAETQCPQAQQVCVMPIGEVTP